MRQYGRLLAMLIAALLLSIMPSAAQESDLAAWEMWLYDQDAGRMWRVAADGSLLADLPLPIPPDAQGAVTYGRGVAVSPDGTQVAYRADSDAGSQVVVYDLVNDALLMTYTPEETVLADTFDLVRDVNLFNLTGSTLAYGYAYANGEWRMLLLNVETGEVSFQIDRADAVGRFSLSQDVPRLPFIQNYSDGVVDFTVVPYQVEAGVQNPSFRWDIVRGGVTATDIYPTLTNDRLDTTGEVVMPITDERLAGTAGSLVTPNNTLHIYNPQVRGRYPYYASERLDFNRVLFIEGGERTLAQALPLDESSSDAVWQIVGRDGTLTNAPALMPIDGQVVGTPEGFAYVADNPTPVLLEVQTLANATDQRAVWTGEPDSRPVPVWVSAPLSFSAQAATFTDWAQLAPPLSQATSVQPQAEATADAQTFSPADVGSEPVRQGNLTVDAVAIVNTTEGDRLNMRARPSLSAEIVARVDDGTRVVVIDGPIAEDNFIWWEVRLPTGLTGWMVERADGVDTLIPVG